MALKYGGKTISNYSAMRGPCSKGFHIPTRAESQALYNAVSSLGLATTGDIYKTYLKIPIAGYRTSDSTISASSQGSTGYYRLCTYKEGTTHYPYRMRVLSSNVAYSDSGYAVHGYPIRPFKDISIIPDSNWTTLYEGDVYGNGTNRYTPGIFWNSTLGLISISSNGNTSDPSVWITIADKNAGATTVYNSGDTLSQSNCGNYFQRGNNYGFPRTGTISNISSTQVDTTGYGPGNFYSDSIYRNTTSNDWFNPVNPDLRGGVTGIVQKPVDIVERYYGGKFINDYSAMRGPCDEGFHIPNKNERENVIAAGATLGAYVRATGSGHVSDSEIPFRLQFKVPRISRREASGELVDASRFGHTHYWTYETSSGGIGYSLGIIDSYGSVRTNIYQSYSSNNEGRPIRPFKDVPVAPDNTRTMTYDGSSVAQGAGIFYNSSLKLISVSADGITRYTIADRDIGATNIYTNASAGVQSDAIGSLFQRGNNYQFSPTGSVTTSATQVDASNYGPGNYYYGSTWITTTQRDSSNNDNLRGGVTGVKQKPVKVIEVYYGSTKIWPSYPAGIYWNPNIDGGVISVSSNGTDWLTLADKNLGATTVYNLGDTMSEANCGKFYQRGNNYGFSYSGTPSRSSTKVNVSSYGPNNYYSNSTFRRVNYTGNWRTDASTTAAFNLWGGVTGTVEAAQGPCSDGFHIPSRGDVTNLVSMYIDLGILSDTDSQAYLKIPRMGFRDNYSAAINNAGTDGGFRSCTINTEPSESTYFPYACECWNESQYQIQLSAGFMNSHCLAIRPFRNEAIMPDDTRVAILN